MNRDEEAARRVSKPKSGNSGLPRKLRLVWCSEPIKTVDPPSKAPPRNNVETVLSEPNEPYAGQPMTTEEQKAQQAHEDLIDKALEQDFLIYGGIALREETFATPVGHEALPNRRPLGVTPQHDAFESNNEYGIRLDRKNAATEITFHDLQQ